MSAAQPILFGIGNPLLDISAPVGEDFLTKYNVKLNNAILAEPSHLPIYGDLVSHYSVSYIAGGATQNSIRVAQWMMPAGSTTYTGCVGKDDYGAQLEKSARGDGVDVQYLITPDHPTGTCAVLIHDNERSLIANLGAANHFSPSHLQTDAIKQRIQSAKFFYSSGFFLTVSPPSLMEIAEHVLANNKVLSINLAAPFICQFFDGPLLAAIPYADYVFGNESEAEAFAQKQGIADTSASSVALAIAALPKKNSSRPRVVVITQGANPTVVAVEGKVTTFTVPPLTKEEIVDVNGAGDAFVGGFLSQLAKGRELEHCVKAGQYAARTILTVSGTILKGKPDDTQF